MQTMKQQNPIELFQKWLDEAEKAGIKEHNAMCLSTVNKLGVPSSRMVLLKDFDENGAVFYTNLNSKKGGDLKENQNVALCFYWNELGKQINIQGTAKLVSNKEADEYFKSRDIRSRLGAWASKQSQKMSGRLELMKQVTLYANKYGLKNVPRPPFWTGYRISIDKIEFWEEGTFRLHKRKLFTKAGINWQMDTLYP